MPEWSLTRWLAHLEALHPRSVDLGLDRLSRVVDAMGLRNPSFRVLSVAGTNGKGSVSYASDALIRGGGHRCGCYTSPHLLDFNERICVDGVPVDDSQIVSAFEAIEAARGDITLTYFEFATLAALEIFRRMAVEVAVLEVGLGGRLDAVNVVDAEVSVITSIDLDHQEWLGSSREKIAREKAGIARPGQPVILAERNYPPSLYEALEERRAIPQRAGQEWDWALDDSGKQPRLSLSLPGSAGRVTGLPVPDGILPANVAAAVAAVSRMLPLPDAQQMHAILGPLQVPARRQRLTVDGRTLVLDVAHNPASMNCLAEWLRTVARPESTYAAIGLMADKDIPAIVAALSPAVSGAFALALPGIGRAEKPEKLWQVLDSMGIAAAQSEFSVAAVWELLLAGSRPGDTLVFCGSFHSVAGIMALLGLSTRSPRNLLAS